MPAQIPNKKYKVPISLWLVENNHLKIGLKNGMTDKSDKL